MYFYMWLYCAFHKSLEVQIMQIYIKKGRRFQLCHQFLATILFLPGSRCGNVPNEPVHGAGPPFLDNHYSVSHHRWNSQLIVVKHDIYYMYLLLYNYVCLNVQPFSVLLCLLVVRSVE